MSPEAVGGLIGPVGEGATSPAVGGAGMGGGGLGVLLAGVAQPART
jgi:hypothetical protein